MPSIPLLASRRGSGRGPKIPIRNRFSRLLVEGLAPAEKVTLVTDSIEVTYEQNGQYDVSLVRIVPGDIVHARLEGENSCVSVWLE